eukprot:s3391_g7.t3
MDELCSNVGGYRTFLRRLALHYFGWWVAIAVVPAVFLDHHRCESSMPYIAWCLYGGTVLAMLVMAVLVELSMVQRLGLLQGSELHVLKLVEGNQQVRIESVLRTAGFDGPAISASKVLLSLVATSQSLEALTSG